MPPVNQETHQQTHQHEEPPKDSSSGLLDAAPPPYTPSAGRLPTSLHPYMAMRSHGIPLCQIQRSLLERHAIRTAQRPITADVVSDVAHCGDDDTTDEAGPAFSFTMRINTAVSVTKDDNMVCLSDNPTEHAKSIAAAVTKALEGSGSRHYGIPMVDGDGNPRPVRIEVDAGIVVDGARNIVGTEDVLLNIMRQREAVRQEAYRRRRQQCDDNTNQSVFEDSEQPSAKRQRSI